MTNENQDATWQRADTTWFYSAGWGVFMHYLTSPATTAEAWSEQVDRFDVEALARQIASVEAGYCFLTIGQGSGHYCAPNATYDRLTGICPSKCSRRDLISDLADALACHKIPMMVYTVTDGSDADPQACAALGQIRHWSDGVKRSPGDYRLPEFQRNWEDVNRDWSLRFGMKVRGWWVDGAYMKPERFPDNEPPNFRTFAEALKAGNPDALVAFNPGIQIPVWSYSEYEDYTAGEIDAALPVGGWGLGVNGGFGPIRRIQPSSISCFI